ncbi:MAG: DUF3105 domain-containing protein [Pseudomonadota bacterium]
MIEQRRRNVGLPAAVCALALQLTECGTASDGGARPAAASGAAGQSGARSEAGSGGLGDAAGSGGSPMSDAGAAGERESGDLGGRSGAGAPATEAGAGGAQAGAAGSGACGVELAGYLSPTAQHVNVCSVIDYPMNPPVYGDHYPVWAAYKSYAFPVPLGFLVHDLEHGAVVYLYNCADGCADEVAAAQAMIDALPVDPRCVDPVKHQVILTPDPTLPTRWAAVAWGHSLTAGCFTAPAFRGFYDANLGHGGEDSCADGADLTPDVCQ